MDFCRNVPAAGELQPEQVLPPPCPHLGVGSFTGPSSLDDLFLNNNPEADFSLEWLSAFVEDCLSSKGNCLPAPTNLQTQKPPKPHELHNEKQQNSSSLQKLAFPSKPRSKRKRNKNPLATWSHNLPSKPQGELDLTSTDPPLLDQTHWLADSELLIMPKKDEGVKKQVVGRRCSHCQAQRTPQWRAGPLGPKTLCNACGVRYKSGRLLPEYRPAKSPTFVSYLHSNSHKKVLEMRMALSSTPPQ